jgi:hypothetical protein
MPPVIRDPRYSLPWQVTIDATTPEGFLLRSTWTDMMDIYEINRKEAARILLDSARWFKPGTFRPKPGSVPPLQADDPPPTGYQLELSVMEVNDPPLFFSFLFFLPFSSIFVYSHDRSSDYHQQHACPAEFAAQADLLLRARHRNLQAGSGDVWPGGREIDPQALRAAQRWSGRGGGTEVLRVVLPPHEQLCVPVGVERMVRSSVSRFLLDDLRLTIALCFLLPCFLLSPSFGSQGPRS